MQHKVFHHHVHPEQFQALGQHHVTSDNKSLREDLFSHLECYSKEQSNWDRYHNLALTVRPVESGVSR